MESKASDMRVFFFMFNLNCFVSFLNNENIGDYGKYAVAPYRQIYLIISRSP